MIHRGLILVGGGALLRGLDALLHSVLHVPVYSAEDPLSAVARGTGVILEDVESYDEVLVHIHDELPSR